MYKRAQVKLNNRSDKPIRTGTYRTNLLSYLGSAAASISITNIRVDPPGIVPASASP